MSVNRTLIDALQDMNRHAAQLAREFMVSLRQSAIQIVRACRSAICNLVDLAQAAIRSFVDLVSKAEAIGIDLLTEIVLFAYGMREPIAWFAIGIACYSWSDESFSLLCAFVLWAGVTTIATLEFLRRRRLHRENPGDLVTIGFRRRLKFAIKWGWRACVSLILFFASREVSLDNSIRRWLDSGRRGVAAVQPRRRGHESIGPTAIAAAPTDVLRRLGARASSELPSAAGRQHNTQAAAIDSAAPALQADASPATESSEAQTNEIASQRAPTARRSGAGRHRARVSVVDEACVLPDLMHYSDPFPAPRKLRGATYEIRYSMNADGQITGVSRPPMPEGRYDEHVRWLQYAIEPNLPCYGLRARAGQITVRVAVI